MNFKAKLLFLLMKPFPKRDLCPEEPGNGHQKEAFTKVRSRLFIEVFYKISYFRLLIAILLQASQCIRGQPSWQLKGENREQPFICQS